MRAAADHARGAFQSPVPSVSIKPPLMRASSNHHATASEQKEPADEISSLHPSQLAAPRPHPTRPASLPSSLASMPSASPSGFGSSSSLTSAESADSGGNYSTVAESVAQQPSVPTQQQRGSVHIVWNLADVPFPTSLPAAYVIDRVHRIAETYGSIATFKAICYNDNNGSHERGNGNGGNGHSGHNGHPGVPSMALKKSLQDHGIEVEEVYRQPNSCSIDLAVLTNILRISIAEVEQQVQAQFQHRDNGASRGSTLVLLASQEDFGRAIQVLRRSSRFADVVVVYHEKKCCGTQGLLASHTPEPIALIRHATVSFEWSQLLRHGLPQQASVVFDHRSPTISQAAGIGHAHERKDARPRSTSMKDLPSLAHASHHRGGSGAYSSFGSSPASSSFNSRASTPSSSSRLSLPPASGFHTATTTATNSRSSSVSSYPSFDNHTPPSSTSARGGMGAVLDITPAFADSNTTNLGELGVELMLERLSPKVRAMVLSFKCVLQYCEDERIIPRESVLKKRLLDTNISGGMADVDFEQLLALSVSCGIAAVEGTAPQRIIYPASSHVDETGSTSRSIRKFECADFFQPTQRLSVAQTRELLEFLSTHRPEVDRGRFGFAQMLSHCLQVGSRVRLFDGSTTCVEKLCLGDQLVGLGGRAATVTRVPEAWVSPDMLTVRHADGSSYAVSSNHHLTLVWNRDTVYAEVTASDGGRMVRAEYWLWRPSSDPNAGDRLQPTLVELKKRASASTDVALKLLELEVTSRHPAADGSSGEPPVRGTRLERGTIIELRALDLFKRQSELLLSPTDGRYTVLGCREPPPFDKPESQHDSNRDLHNVIAISSLERSPPARVIRVEIDGDHRFQLWDGTVTHNSAPPAIKSLPHGVLVELVQLLLNQKVLLFRKGRVSTNPNLNYADLHALAALCTASKPHTALLSTTKGAQGQQAAGALKALYAQLRHDIDAHNARKSTNPAFSTPGATNGGGNGSTPSSRPFSAPSSPVLWQQQPSTTSSASSPFQSSWPSPQLPPLGSRDQPDAATVGLDDHDYGGFHLPTTGEFDTSLLDRGMDIGASATIPASGPVTPPNHSSQSTQSSATSETSTPRAAVAARWIEEKPAFQPQPQQDHQPQPQQLTYMQVFAHKFLQSKWGPMAQSVRAQPQRFPFAPLWHTELRMLPATDTSEAQSFWSASCAFDLSDELHSFSAVDTQPELDGAMESLACQILHQPVAARLTWSCLLQELRVRRRDVIPDGGVSTKRLPFLLTDPNELTELERSEAAIGSRAERIIQEKLSSHPVLHLDSLLSSLAQPQMIYSCEQVEVPSPQGPLMAWSVAAALPTAANDATMNAYSVTSLQATKSAGKQDCASRLLTKLRQSRPRAPPQVGASSHMNPKAAPWTPNQPSRFVATEPLDHDHDHAL